MSTSLERVNAGLETLRDAPAAAGAGYRFTTTGIIFDDDFNPSFQEFDALGHRTVGVAVASYFAFCDWLEFGRKKFGKRIDKSQTCALAQDHFRVRLSQPYVEQLLSTVRRILPENRDIPATISHHRTVADLKDVTEQRGLLEKVAREGLSVKQTRKEVARLNRSPVPFTVSLSLPGITSSQSREAWAKATLTAGTKALNEAIKAYLNERSKD